MRLSYREGRQPAKTSFYVLGHVCHAGVSLSRIALHRSRDDSIELTAQLMFRSRPSGNL